MPQTVRGWVEGAYGLGFLYLCLIARGGELIITCGMEQTGLPVDFEVAMNDPPRRITRQADRYRAGPVERFYAIQNRAGVDRAI